MTRSSSLPVPQAPLRAVAYGRVSKEDQATPDKASLDQQHTANTALAARLGAELLQTFIDAGASGGTDDRPQFQAMVAWCEAHPEPVTRPGLILVLNDSRWGRWPNPERAAYWRSRLEESGWLVKYSEHDDTEDVTTRTIMRALHSSQATAYREAVRQNAKRGSRGTAEQGFWQNEAPIGYRRKASDPSGRERVLDVGQRKAMDERVRLTPGPEVEVALVRWLFETYVAGGISLNRLAKAAAERCALHGLPRRRWAVQTLAAILKNPAYMGDVVWCRRTNDPRERVDGVRRKQEDWVVVRDAHPPLLERALFDRVQTRLAANRRETSPTPGGYMLSGLITCGTCGNHFIGGGGPKGPPEEPDRFRFYRDYGADTGACPGSTTTVGKLLLERAFVARIGQVLASEASQARLQRAFDRRLKAQTRGTRDEVGRYLKRQRQLEAERDRLARAVALGAVEPADVAPVMAELRDDLARAQEAASRARFAERRVTPVREEMERLIAMTRDFPALLAQLPGVRRRELLRPWIESAIFDKFTRQLDVTVADMPTLTFGLSDAPGPGSP